ncbi:ATP-binding protein [Mycolicibacterium thermoresistibile]
MIEPFPSASSAHPVSAGALADYFERLGVPADAASAAQVREQFAAWLGRFFDVDAVKSSDMVLATNEALANAAEFATCTPNGPARWTSAPTTSPTTPA